MILEELDVAEPRRPASYRLVDQGAGTREVAEAVKLIREAKSPILLVGHGVHTSRTQQEVKELAELMACPVIQTSGGTSFIPGLRTGLSRTFSPAANEAVEESTCVSRWAPNSVSPCTTAGPSIGPRTKRPARWVYVEQDPPPSASTGRSTWRWSAICAVSCPSW